VKNQKKLKPVKAAFCGRARANEIILRVNLPWGVDMPWPGTEWGEVSVRYADNAITIDLSQLKTQEFVVCDNEGNQRTIRTIGYEVITPAP